MPTFSSALLPTTNGLSLGSSSLRWSCFLQDIDVAGTPTFSSLVNIANFEGIRFADQYPGATPTQQLDAAIADMGGTGCVVASPTMAAGAPTSLFANAVLIDLRPSGGAFKLYSGSVVTPKLSITSAGIVSSAFVSTSSNVATSGTLRLANGDSIIARNAANTANIVLLTTIGDQITLANGGQTTFMNGPLIIAGAFTGATTASFSGQITSTLATGTAPFSITSTTVVPNLNVATLNGVTVSGTPAASGYSLVSTSTSAASWSSSAGTYKLENAQYTPTTFVSSAGGAYFTYSLSANELAVGQSLRITASGLWTNTTGGIVTITFTIKAGATTWATYALTLAATATSNARWECEALAICTASGSSGTVEVQGTGYVDQRAAVTGFQIVGNTSTVAFDTTSSQSLTVNVSQGVSATLSTSGRQFLVERLG